MYVRAPLPTPHLVAHAQAQEGELAGGRDAEEELNLRGQPAGQQGQVWLESGGLEGKCRSLDGW